MIEPESARRVPFDEGAIDLLRWHRYRRRWTAAFAGYIALLLAVGSIWPDRPGFNLSLQCAAPAFAALALGYTARRGRGSYGTFWRLLSYGCFLYVLALLVWIYYIGIARTDPPNMGVADLLWNGQSLLFMLALCYLMAKERSVFQGLKVAMDALILFVFITVLAWEYVIEPNLWPYLTSGDRMKVAGIVVYTISDLVIVFSLLVIAYTYRDVFPAGVQKWLTAGLFSFVFGNIAYMIQTIEGTYRIGNWVDAVYSVGLLLSAIAGLESAEGSAGAERGAAPPRAGRWMTLAFALSPYAAVVVLIAIPIFHPGSDRSEIAIANGFVAALILGRQAFVLAENRSLLRGTLRLLQETDYLANHDTVTGLPNRLHFEKALEDALASHDPEDGEQLAVLFLDLDRFKYINDSYGHGIGDELLRQIADRLRDEAEGPHLVSRRGGDEFTVLLRGLRSSEEIRDWAERFIRRLAQPVQAENCELLTATSVGVAVYGKDAHSLTELLKNADAAMYKAKALGGGRCCFYTEELDRAFARKATLEHSLRRALDRGEFALYYQPMYETVSGRLVGMEALLRWHTKHGAVVSPAEFVPLAEETGLIVPIGEWVLREACRYAKRWVDTFPGTFRMAVNVSPVQFEQADFVERTVSVMRETGLAPESLALEITESLMRNDEAIRKLERLKARGIQVSLDDFGTGYSSLSDLHRLPVDTLKIAQSFTKDMPGNEKLARIVKAIIALAKNLDLRVVAEGVETEEQFLYMHRHGIDVIQGYYFSKPLPGDELRARAGRSAS